MITRKQFIKSAGVFLAALISLPLISKLIGRWGASKEEAILKLYSEMIPIIKDRLEYEGLARQVLAVRKLRQGEIQRYPKEIGVTSMMIQEDGKTIETASKWDKLFPPEFLVSATSTLPKELLEAIMAEPREYSKEFFEFMDTELDKCSFEIMLQEDRNVLRLLYHSALNSGNVLHIDQLDRKNFNQFKRTAEDNSFAVDKIVMNRAELGDLRSNVKTMEYDPILSRSALLSGNFGSLDGINIYITAGVDMRAWEFVSVPEGMIFILPKPEELGIMPERISLTVVPAMRMLEGRELGRTALLVEQISQVVFDTSKVIVAMKPNCVIPRWLEEDSLIV